MMEKQEESKNKKLIKSGQNFLGILNDIKRRPEDAARTISETVQWFNPKGKQ